MKIRYLIEAFWGLSAAYLIYIFIKKGINKKRPTPQNVKQNDCTESKSDVSDNHDINIEPNCETTKKQVCSNIEKRNAMASQVLSDIHDDMVKSVENIDEKKANIEKLMNSLKD